MDDVAVHGGDRLDRRRGADLTVEGVAGFDDQRVAGADTGDGRKVGMPAVVPRRRVVAERLAAVDSDFHGRHVDRPIGGRCERRA